MGFASALDIADLARVDKAVALLAFNLGIEFVQLLLVGFAAVSLLLLLRVWPMRQAQILRVAACSIGAVGGLWFWERALISLAQFNLA